MTINLSALKKSSSSDLLNKLKKGIESSNTRATKEKDTRFWNPTIDSAGNGSATIRFLPAKTEDDFPFIKVHRHAFQENGMWFIKECPSAIGLPCPVCEDNRSLWNSGNEADKEIARKHKRETKYIANILVIKDPADPSNDGQLRLYKFGKKIYDKLVEAMNADPELGEEPINPFSFFDGGNFVIRTQTVGGFLNFDKCKVVPTADLYDGDEEKLTALMESLYDLKEFADPKLFEPYEKIKERFLKVTGAVSEEQFEQVQKTPAKEYSPAAEKASTPQAQRQDDTDTSSTESAGGDDDDLAFFKNLLK